MAWAVWQDGRKIPLIPGRGADRFPRFAPSVQGITVSNLMRRLQKRFRNGFEKAAAWSDTPKGRLVLWLISIAVPLISASTGSRHPLV